MTKIDSHHRGIFARYDGDRPTSSEMPGNLRLVMQEICHVMGARAAILTSHLFGERPSATIWLTAGAPLPDDPARLLEACGKVAQRGSCGWADISGSELFLMPVEPVQGHSRLVIAACFEAPDAKQRAAVEGIYRDRRPFAIGYFHLWQANRIQARRCAALATVLDITDIGVLLIDRTIDIAFANDAAESMLSKGDGLRRYLGSVRATDIRDSVSLQIALEHAAGGPGSDPNLAPTLALHRKAGPPLIVSIVPAKPEPVEPSDVSAIMYVVDPNLDVKAMLTPICALYRLSPIETALVYHLTGGSTIAAAAEEMRIKEQTARTYLKQIFIKTATNRQAELVALMLSSLTRIRGDFLQKVVVGSKNSVFG